MYVYCLFCQTQKCRSIAAELERRGIPRAFSPRILNHRRVRGRNIDQWNDLLPGYIFLFSEEELPGSGFLQGVTGVIRRIGETENGYVLTGTDRDFAMGLLRRDGLVGQVTVHREGDIVTVDEPLFEGTLARITQMDHRKQRARLEYMFAGVTCHTWIACDMISRAASPREEKDAPFPAESSQQPILESAHSLCHKK